MPLVADFKRNRKVVLDRTPTKQAMDDADAKGCAFIMLGKGNYALVDNDDYCDVSRFNWHKSVLGYAVTFKRINGKRGVLMHRFIMGLDAGGSNDHKNRNTTDNRRCNLRPCDHTMNNGNKTVRCDNQSSQFKGVAFNKTERKFYAHGKFKGKNFYLGRFLDEHSAAIAYNEWASKTFGEFALLNAV